jgi:hypothetical protein
MEHIYWRHKILKEEKESMLASTDHAWSVLTTIANRDKRIHGELLNNWDSARFEDDPKRKKVSANIDPKDKFLQAFARACAYSSILVKNKKKATELIRKVMQTGGQ